MSGGANLFLLSVRTVENEWQVAMDVQECGRPDGRGESNR